MVIYLSVIRTAGAKRTLKGPIEALKRQKRRAIRAAKVPKKYSKKAVDKTESNLVRCNSVSATELDDRAKERG